ncbi:MAG: GTPase [Candidatus Microgenomates bacterium]|jgi:small GTP-binding protein
MDDISEQIEFVKKELRDTPYHKGTEHYIGKLRARLARLKDKELEGIIKSKGGGGGGGYAVKKQGDATIVLIGPPSSGKSTLINKITNAESKVAPYDFTTVSVVPGMLIYNDAYIQILDVPGLIQGARMGKGRGKEVLSVARASDLLVIMTDVQRLDFIDTLKAELEESGIRINKEKPKVKIEKKVDGGLTVFSNIRQDLTQEMVKNIAQEMGFKNGSITLNEMVTMDQLIDSFSRSRVYIPAIFVINKIDENKAIEKDLRNKGYLTMSARDDADLVEFKQLVWKSLKFIKVNLIDSPIIMKEGQTLADLANKIGTDFSEKYKTAKIWGSIAKFPGQEVPLTTPLVEGLQVKFLV